MPSVQDFLLLLAGASGPGAAAGIGRGLEIKRGRERQAEQDRIAAEQRAEAQRQQGLKEQFTFLEALSRPGVSVATEQPVGGPAVDVSFLDSFRIPDASSLTDVTPAPTAGPLASLGIAPPIPSRLETTATLDGTPLPQIGGLETPTALGGPEGATSLGIFPFLAGEREMFFDPTQTKDARAAAEKETKAEANRRAFEAVRELDPDSFTELPPEIVDATDFISTLNDLQEQQATGKITASFKGAGGPSASEQAELRRQRNRRAKTAAFRAFEQNPDAGISEILEQVERENPDLAGALTTDDLVDARKDARSVRDTAPENRAKAERRTALSKAAPPLSATDQWVLGELVDGLSDDEVIAKIQRLGKQEAALQTEIDQRVAEAKAYLKRKSNSVSSRYGVKRKVRE